MRHKKIALSIITLLSLMAFLSSTAVFAAEVPKDKYTVTVQNTGTVKEKVNFPDYEIDGREFEMILVPTGSEIRQSAARSLPMRTLLLSPAGQSRPSALSPQRAS